MDEQALMEENQRLKRELQELAEQREADAQAAQHRLGKERASGLTYQEQAQTKQGELDSMRNRMVTLGRQLDEEVTKRDEAQQESQILERRMQELSDGSGLSMPRSGKGLSFEAPPGGGKKEAAAPQASTKLMNIVGQWMRTKDLQQALMRNASVNDMGFQTLVQVLYDCPSLQMLDLSQNQLTMDSCHHICQIITNRPNLSYLSLEGNRFSMRSIGYLMTAIMERQSMKKFAPLDLLDLQGNEGLVAALHAPPPEDLVKQVLATLGSTRLPPRGAELVVQTMRALWQFLHATQHPQVKDASVDDVAFHLLDRTTIRKMENALSKIVLLQSEDDAGGNRGPSAVQSVTADLAFMLVTEAPAEVSFGAVRSAPTDAVRGDAVHLPPIEAQSGTGFGGKQVRVAKARSTPELRNDPFADLKSAFEPVRDKLRTFNLKQILTPNGTVLMNMLERLLETTQVDARDVETEKTLLEHACSTGNLGLAKLCYRRGANLSQRTASGDTCFNIVTRNRNYGMMEFLHTYGVKVNFEDAEGKTALHMAAGKDDVDAICRLLEWGADVNVGDKRKRTPLHTAAAAGWWKATMLLLEVGADLNAKDDREYTAVAHAEAHDHFALMDRLNKLGGKGHGLAQKKDDDREATLKKLGNLREKNEGIVTLGMQKKSSMGRIGKVAASGMDLRPNANSKNGSMIRGALDMNMMPRIGLAQTMRAR